MRANSLLVPMPYITMIVTIACVCAALEHMCAILLSKHYRTCVLVSHNRLFRKIPKFQPIVQVALIARFQRQLLQCALQSVMCCL